MASMNVGRVVAGGLLAGLIINISEFVLNQPILGEKWKEALEAIDLQEPGTGAIAFFIVTSFVLGLLTVWMYAAMRPRLGAGPKSAMIAGLFVWLLYYGLVNVSIGLMGVFSFDLLGIVLGWSIVEMSIAAVIGCAIYKEAT